jgi:hypothetical protein
LRLPRSIATDESWEISSAQSGAGAGLDHQVENQGTGDMIYLSAHESEYLTPTPALDRWFCRFDGRTVHFVIAKPVI